MSQTRSRQSLRSGAAAQPRPVREGSPWTGMWSVVFKEMADHLSSTRIFILDILILLAAVGTVFVATQYIQQTVSQDEFLYLRLFTTSRQPLPSFVSLLGFFIPLVAIALTFDAVNGEFRRRTMSRILAQPIYRDALLMGKFLASLFTLANGQKLVQFLQPFSQRNAHLFERFTQHTDFIHAADRDGR